MLHGNLLNKRVSWAGAQKDSNVIVEVVAICDGIWGWSEIWSCDEARMEYAAQTPSKRHQVVKGGNKPIVVLRVQKTPKTWAYHSLYSESEVRKLVVRGDADFRSHIGDLRGVTLDCKIGSNEYNRVKDAATPK